MPYALALLGGEFIRDKHLTGYWAWELPRVPSDWALGLSAVHDVAVPSRFTAEAVVGLSPELCVRIAPHPVALAYPKRGVAPEDVEHRPFTIVSACSMASGFNRKNPCATIRAFRRAFGNDPSKKLKLLATNVDHFPQAHRAIKAEMEGAGNIEVAWTVLDPVEFARWWSEGDVYMSLHRSEGFGLPLAEALCGGMPVVATGWSGNIDFMDAANSYLLEYSLIDVHDAQGKYPDDLGQWAEASIEHAAAMLADLAINRASASAKAFAQAPTVQRKLSAKVFVDALVGVNQPAKTSGSDAGSSFEGIPRLRCAPGNGKFDGGSSPVKRVLIDGGHFLSKTATGIGSYARTLAASLQAAACHVSVVYGQRVQGS